MKSWISILILLLCLPVLAQTQLNVTNYGANGNAVYFLANCTSNSATFNCTNSNFLVSNTVELFACGPWGVGNLVHQDMVAYITSISQGTNITLDRPIEQTTNGAVGVCGTNNAMAFQDCINAAPSNSIINIPAGVYLIMTASNYTPFTMLNPYYTWGAIYITNGGGFTISGAGRTNTTLLGPGAWQNMGPYGYRGIMWDESSPETNLSTITFQHLNMDGGVLAGYTPNGGGNPVNWTNGIGWDNTHHCFADGNAIGNGNLSLGVTFNDCWIHRWEGEQLEGTSSQTNRYIVVTNCTISDGDATALNEPYSHSYVNDIFSNLNEVEEFYGSYTRTSSVMSGCFATNFNNFVSLEGGTTDGNQPYYYITNNQIYGNGSGSGFLIAPFTNAVISGNTIEGFVIGVSISSDSGLTPVDPSNNGGITIAGNLFTNVYYGVQFGADSGLIGGVTLINNTYYQEERFLINSGYGTNIYSYSNTVYEPTMGYIAIDSTGAFGQYIYDDPSDNFPPYLFYPTAATNYVTYAYGRYQQIIPASANKSVFLDDVNAAKMPNYAQLLLTNVSSTYSVTLYTSTTNAVAGQSFAPNTGLLFYWNQFTGQWQTNSAIAPNPIFYLFYNR